MSNIFQRPGRRQRGFALLDYVCGTAILVSSLISISTLHTIRVRALREVRQSQRASFLLRSRLVEATARWSTPSGYGRQVAGAPGVDGWKVLSRRSGTELSKDLTLIFGKDLTLVKRCRPAPGADGFYELSLELSWKTGPKSTRRRQLSTLVPEVSQ